MGRLILNSKGINTRSGAMMIRSAICENGLKAPDVSSIYVVSYPDYGIDDRILENLTKIIGFERDKVMFSADGLPDTCPDYIYVTEGNTFEILLYMQRSGLVDYIREMMNSRDDVVYIGSSAGALIAGTDILPAKDFDNNPVGRMDYSSLGLFDGAILPHLGAAEFEMYRSNNDLLLSSYTNVLHVGNDDVLVI